jgi:hypothetical protein
MSSGWAIRPRGRRALSCCSRNSPSCGASPQSRGSFVGSAAPNSDLRCWAPRQCGNDDSKGTPPSHGCYALTSSIQSRIHLPSRYRWNAASAPGRMCPSASRSRAVSSTRAAKVAARGSRKNASRNRASMISFPSTCPIAGRLIVDLIGRRSDADPLAQSAAVSLLHTYASYDHLPPRPLRLVDAPRMTPTTGMTPCRIDPSLVTRPTAPSIRPTTSVGWRFDESRRRRCLEAVGIPEAADGK